MWKHTIVKAEGHKKIKAAVVMRLSNENNSIIGDKIKISCDLLCVSGGSLQQSIYLHNPVVN